MTEKSSDDDDANASDETDKKVVPSKKEPIVTTKDYVAATLNAWNNCPTIVKKQLDKQSEEIESLSLQLREVNLKLTQRKHEMERTFQAQMKSEL